MARKNRTPKEKARREKLCELLQMAKIGSIDDIQTPFKETLRSALARLDWFFPAPGWESGHGCRIPPCRSPAPQHRGKTPGRRRRASPVLPDAGPRRRSPPCRASDTGCPCEDRSAASFHKATGRSPGFAWPCSRTPGWPPAGGWSGRRAWAAPLSSVHG